MEVSALKYAGAGGLHGRSPLLRLQSDDRLIAYVRRGNNSAFETLVSRYEARLLAFCRHMLGSREDAEDVLQEVFAAAFNAILADDRPINVRPWLYRIARNRSLNHLRRIQAIGVDSMDVHFSDNGASTADKVHNREEFRLLVGDIQDLPETQRTALLLREMDALSYDQIAEAMETTVPSVKSLLVRARVSLAEAAESRLLTCEEVRIELGEIAEGLRRRPEPLVRRHLKSCDRCASFRTQLRHTNKALAALLPIGPLVILKKLAVAHLGHSAGAGSGATAAGGSASAAGAVAGTGAAGGGFSLVGAGVGAVATKAAAGLAAAALVTAGAVEVEHSSTRVRTHHHMAAISAPQFAAVAHHVFTAPTESIRKPVFAAKPLAPASKPKPAPKPAAVLVASAKAPVKPTIVPATKTTTTTPAAVPAPGRSQTQTDQTVLPTGTTTTISPTTPSPTSTAPVITTPETPPPPATSTPSDPTTPPAGLPIPVVTPPVVIPPSDPGGNPAGGSPGPGTAAEPSSTPAPAPAG
jgi:RNA polymerase sigma factor (sigma-70 family)